MYEPAELIRLARSGDVSLRLKLRAELHRTINRINLNFDRDLGRIKIVVRFVNNAERETRQPVKFVKPLRPRPS